ncbi:MAG: hypothetical protein ACXVZX_10620 [Terriglobales bacterium]
MWKRSPPGQSNNPLKTFGMFLALFFCILVIGTLIAMFRTYPELRSPAAWLPYDVTAETKVSGVVEVVQEFQCPWSGTGSGIHLVLKTDRGTVYVHAGDARFLRAHRAIFNRGDRIEVVGLKLSVGGKEALIARELNRGGSRFTVRDAQGKPLWITE